MHYTHLCSYECSNHSCYSAFHALYILLGVVNGQRFLFSIPILMPVFYKTIYSDL